MKRKYQIAPTHPDALADQRSLEHELIPGQLSVRIMKLWPKSGRKEFPCWAFVSRGLRRHGHPEVALLLEQLEGEQVYPREPLRLFEVIDRIIAGGQHFGVGDVTELPRSPLPGFHLAYIPPPTVSTNPLPPSTLCAILVTSEELGAIRDFGFTRVMARLGEAARIFPCPFWSDRSRSGLSFGDTRQHSILSKAARIRARGGRVHLDGNQVFFRLPRGTGAALSRSLREAPTGQLVGFLTGSILMAMAAGSGNPARPNSRPLHRITPPAHASPPVSCWSPTMSNTSASSRWRMGSS